jgi:hypothetical protein
LRPHFFLGPGSNQRVWLASSWDRTGLEDEPQGEVRVAVVELEEVCPRLALLEEDERREDVAGDSQI